MTLRVCRIDERIGRWINSNDTVNGFGFRSAVLEKLRIGVDDVDAQKGYPTAQQHPAQRPADHSAIPVKNLGRLPYPFASFGEIV
jgi:hypothetical protein